MRHPLVFCFAWGALASSCASTSVLPDLTGKTLDDVRTGHAALVAGRGVHRVLRNGVEQYFFVGGARAEDDDPRAFVEQEASLDARDALLEHLVPVEKRDQRALDLHGVKCPYAWTVGDRVWRGCFVAVDAVAVRDRTTPARPPNDAPVAAPAAAATPGTVPLPATAPARPVGPVPTSASGPTPPAPSSSANDLLARARALAAHGDCRAAVAVYDQLLEQHASFSIAAGLVREKFETQKVCP